MGQVEPKEILRLALFHKSFEARARFDYEKTLLARTSSDETIRLRMYPVNRHI